MGTRSPLRFRAGPVHAGVAAGAERDRVGPAAQRRRPGVHRGSAGSGRRDGDCSRSRRASPRLTAMSPVRRRTPWRPGKNRGIGCPRPRGCRRQARARAALAPAVVAHCRARRRRTWQPSLTDTPTPRVGRAAKAEPDSASTHGRGVAGIAGSHATVSAAATLRTSTRPGATCPSLDQPSRASCARASRPGAVRASSAPVRLRAAFAAVLP